MKRPPPLAWEEYKELGYYVNHWPCYTVAYTPADYLYIDVRHKKRPSSITWFYSPKQPNEKQLDEYFNKLELICRQQEQDFGWSAK